MPQYSCGNMNQEFLIVFCITFLIIRENINVNYYMHRTEFGKVMSTYFLLVFAICDQVFRSN